MAARRKRRPKARYKSGKGALIKGMSRRLSSELLDDPLFRQSLQKIMRSYAAPSEYGGLPEGKWDYVDEHGNYLFHKERWGVPEPHHATVGRKKLYTIARVTGDGYQRGRGDAPPVLFQLPAVLRAVREGLAIVITEGEKDALLAQEKLPGCVGTTVPDHSWLEEHTAAVRGAAPIHVVLDPDPGGWERARLIVDALERAGTAFDVRAPADGVDFEKVGWDDLRDVTPEECGSARRRPRRPSPSRSASAPTWRPGAERPST